MNPLIDEIYRTYRAQDLDGNPVDVSTAGVPRFDGEMLYKIVREARPKQSLETGFAYGLSTLFIAQALHDNGEGHHTAVDPFEVSEFKGVGVANVRRAGLEDRFTFVEDYSANALPRLLHQGLKLDFAFIDGHHTFDAAFLDFFYCDVMLGPGGLVVFHDFSMPAVRKVVTFILRNLPYDLHMEGIARPLGLPQKIYHRMRMMARYPTEVYGWKYSDFWAQCNYCILRKRAIDARPWDHYKDF